MELWIANRDANAIQEVTLDDIFDEAELIVADNRNKIIYMNPECAQKSEYNMEFYLSGATSEVAKVIRAILRRVDEEIMNREITEIRSVVSAINESPENQTWFSRSWTRIRNVFRRERRNSESAMQNETTTEYSSIKCCCFGKLFCSEKSSSINISNESSLYSDWSNFFKESAVVKNFGSWGWRPLRSRRRRREPN